MKSLPMVMVGAFVVIVTALMAQDRIADVRLGYLSSAWVETQAEVTRSGVIRTAGTRRSGPATHLEFNYIYYTQGAAYEGDRVAFTAVHLDRVPHDYPDGAVIDIYYDPEDPSLSVVEPGLDLEKVAGSLAPFAAFAFVGLGLVVWGVRG